MPARKAVLALSLALALVGVTTAAALGVGQGRQAAQSGQASAALEEPADATLVVVVEATGADATFPFEASGEGLPSAFNLTTVDGTARLSFGGLRAEGAYSLAGRVPAGWRLSAAACDAGTPEAIALSANGTTTCTFGNLQLGTLLVQVNATGADGIFPFQGAGGHGLPASFNVTTTNGTGQAVFLVEPDVTLGLAPLLPAGWNLTAAACTTGVPANLTLAPGARATCGFDATRLNALVVHVNAVGADATFPFAATGEGIPASFNVTTSGGWASLAFSDLPADRTYSLQGLVPSGWKRSAASCTSGTPASFTMAAGESVTCTFNHTRLGAVDVRVLSRGGDATFHFGGSGVGGVPSGFAVATTQGAGTLTHAHVDPDVTQGLTLVPLAGWRLVASACTTGTPAQFSAPAGGVVTCTFELTRLAEVHGVLAEDADRDGLRDAGEPGLAGWRVYLDRDGDGAHDAAEPSALTNATGVYALRELAPATSVLRLVPVPGWTLVLPAGGAYAVALTDGLVLAGLDFAAVPTPAPASLPVLDGFAGPGFWRNWDSHGKYGKDALDGWLRDVAATSAWLLPASYANGTEGMERLFVDSTKGCERDLGREACARLKFEVRLLVLRLNLASGRVSGDALVNVAPDAREMLGLGGTATVKQVVDAVEAKAGGSYSRAHYQALRHAVSLGSGGD